MVFRNEGGWLIKFGNTGATNGRHKNCFFFRKNSKKYRNPPTQSIWMPNFFLIRKFWIGPFGENKSKKSRFFCKGNFGFGETPPPFRNSNVEFFRNSRLCILVLDISPKIYASICRIFSQHTFTHSQTKIFFLKFSHIFVEFCHDKTFTRFC